MGSPQGARAPPPRLGFGLIKAKVSISGLTGVVDAAIKIPTRSKAKSPAAKKVYGAVCDFPLWSVAAGRPGPRSAHCGGCAKDLIGCEKPGTPTRASARAGIMHTSRTPTRAAMLL